MDTVQLGGTDMVYCNLVDGCIPDGISYSNNTIKCTVLNISHVGLFSSENETADYHITIHEYDGIICIQPIEFEFSEFLFNIAEHLYPNAQFMLFYGTIPNLEKVRNTNLKFFTYQVYSDILEHNGIYYLYYTPFRNQHKIKQIPELLDKYHEILLPTK